MSGENIQAGLVLIAIIFIVIAVPCTLIAWIGCKMINKLSRYPSKTPAIQMGILLKVVVVEIISVALLLMFYSLMMNLSG